MRNRRVVQTNPADEWQAQPDAIEVEPEVQPQDVEFDAFLQADAGAQQAEKGDLHAAARW